MSDTGVIDKIKSAFSDSVLESHTFRGDQTVIVKKECIVELLKFLRDDPGLAFNFLMDITAVDYMERKTVRFEVVYHLYSLQYNLRVRIKLPVGEDNCHADSVVHLFKTANWYEREIWDLYGVKFKGHPNLKRILLYEGFRGHPLRKDYPINKRQPLIGPLN